MSNPWSIGDLMRSMSGTPPTSTPNFNESDTVPMVPTPAQPPAPAAPPGIVAAAARQMQEQLEQQRRAVVQDMARTERSAMEREMDWRRSQIDLWADATAPRRGGLITDIGLATGEDTLGRNEGQLRRNATDTGFYLEGQPVLHPPHYYTPIYVAAPFNRREEAKQAVAAIVSENMVSTATWIHAHTTELDELNPDTCAKEAAIDLDGIDRAKWCVFIHPNLSTTGGMHVEFGYALARKKNIIIVGERSNIFHHLALVKRRCGTIGDAIATIKGERW